MDAKIATFGSIFSYGGQDYVFLAHNVASDFIYAAKILDDEKTIEWKRLADARERSGKYNLKSELFYCFVILKTEDFVNQAAVFGFAEKDRVEISTIHNELSGEDKEALKKAIIESGVSATLIQLIKASTE